MCLRGSHMHVIALLPGWINLLGTKEEKQSWPKSSSPALKPESREQPSGLSLLKMATQGPGPSTLPFPIGRRGAEG